MRKIYLIAGTHSFSHGREYVRALLSERVRDFVERVMRRLTYLIRKGAKYHFRRRMQTFDCKRPISQSDAANALLLIDAPSNAGTQREARSQLLRGMAEAQLRAEILTQTESGISSDMLLRLLDDEKVAEARAAIRGLPDAKNPERNEGKPLDSAVLVFGIGEEAHAAISRSMACMSAVTSANSSSISASRRGGSKT